MEAPCAAADGDQAILEGVIRKMGTDDCPAYRPESPTVAIDQDGPCLRGGVVSPQLLQDLGGRHL